MSQENYICKNFVDRSHSNLSPKLMRDIYYSSMQVYNFLNTIDLGIIYVDVRSNMKSEILLVCFFKHKIIENLCHVMKGMVQYCSLYASIVGSEIYHHIDGNTYIYNYIDGYKIPISGSTSMQSNVRTIQHVHNIVQNNIPKDKLIFCNIYPNMINLEEVKNTKDIPIYFRMTVLLDDLLVTLSENKLSYPQNMIIHDPDCNLLVDFLLQNKRQYNLVLTRGRSKPCKISKNLMNIAREYLLSLTILSCEYEGLMNDIKIMGYTNNDIIKITQMPEVFPDSSFVETLITLSNNQN